MTNLQTTLVVLERTGAWAAALRRILNASPVRLLETRSLDECRQRILQYPMVVALLELTAANAASLAAMLVQMQSQAPELRAIVVANRQLAGYENLLREAGAIHFLVSSRSLGEVAEIVRRRYRGSSPRRKPWKTTATTRGRQSSAIFRGRIRFSTRHDCVGCQAHALRRHVSAGTGGHWRSEGHTATTPYCTIERKICRQATCRGRNAMADGQLSEAAVQAVLAEFKDPETGRSVVETDQVRDVRLAGRSLSLSLALTTHSAPLWQETQAELAQLLRDRLPELADVQVQLAVHHRPPVKLGQMGLMAKSVIAVGVGQRGRRQKHDRRLPGARL